MRDSDFLKSLHIEPCAIPEPSPAVRGSSIDCCVEDGNVTMGLGSFNSLLSANHNLADQLTAAQEVAREATRDMRNWQFAFFVLALGMVGAMVISGVSR